MQIILNNKKINQVKIQDVKQTCSHYNCQRVKRTSPSHLSLCPPPPIGGELEEEAKKKEMGGKEKNRRSYL